MILEKLNSVILFQLDQTTKIAKQFSQREMDAIDIGVTVEQWVILKMIEERPGLSQVELANITFRDPASITRTLDLLSKKKLIVRKPIQNNRRSFQVELTKEGDYFILQNSGMINELRKRALKGFTKNEAELLSSMLLKIQKNFT